MTSQTPTPVPDVLKDYPNLVKYSESIGKIIDQLAFVDFLLSSKAVPEDARERLKVAVFEFAGVSHEDLWEELYRAGTTELLSRLVGASAACDCYIKDAQLQKPIDRDDLALRRAERHAMKSVMNVLDSSTIEEISAVEMSDG